jgi:hypothetical protein
VAMKFFNFNRSNENDVRYFVLFPDAAEKQAFADTMCNAAMSNMRCPFANATTDGELFALIMVRKEFVEFWQKKHPRIRFAEAKHLEASWGDDY